MNINVEKMVQYRCVACDNMWDSKTIPTQCGKCRSYDLMEETKYQGFIGEVKNISSDSPHLRLEVLKAKVNADGLRLKPISTLNIVEKVLEDFFPQVPVGAAITPSGHVASVPSGNIPESKP